MKNPGGRCCRPEQLNHSRVRSTENDIDRTSGLKSEFFFESAFPQRTTAGYTPGFANIPWASRAASCGSRPIVTSSTSNWARAQTPFACVPRANGRCCWAAARRLHLEGCLDNFLDVRRFSGEVPLTVATGHSETSGEPKHGLKSP